MDSFIVDNSMPGRVFLESFVDVYFYSSAKSNDGVF